MSKRGNITLTRRECRQLVRLLDMLDHAIPEYVSGTNDKALGRLDAMREFLLDKLGEKVPTWPTLTAKA